MKVTKSGKAKLEKGEIRVGNFFIKEEESHIKVQDLNSVFSHRVDKRMPIGIWLSNMLSLGDGGMTSIKTYIAAMWSLFSVVPDNEFIDDVLKTAHSCLDRHKDWYNVRERTEKDDEKAIEEVRGMTEFEEAVKAEARKED